MLKEKVLKCLGCSACAAVCPRNAIQMVCDDEGFLNPNINDSCVSCGLCEKVCPALKSFEEKTPIIGYCGWHKDENIVRHSSSGGAFSAICESLPYDAVIFGAFFDKEKEKLMHIGVNKDNLSLIRLSKYVESDVSDSFLQIKNLLKERKVLFCGTPCQVAGLLSSTDDKENLLTVDFVCHGTPSLYVLKKSFEYISKKQRDDVKDANFRSKANGWEMSIIKYIGRRKSYIKNSRLDPYLRAFQENISLKKACNGCRFSSAHQSDITVADFWGVNAFNKKINKEKGISLILINTEKGKKAFENAKDNMVLFDLDKRYYSYAIQKSAFNLDIIRKRDVFFKALSNAPIDVATELAIGKVAFLEKCEIYAKHFIKHILNL